MANHKDSMCFVLMPSGNNGEYAGGADEANSVFEEIITPAVTQALGPNAEILREVDNNKPGAITRSIVTRIAEADIVIVDITGKNPNVFLELGMRYALRKNGTVLMRRAETVIPFDIQVHRSIEYNPWRKTDVIKKLSESITTAKSDTSPDSLVYDVYHSLEVHLNDRSESEGLMPWLPYWTRLQRIALMLQEADVEGRYSRT